VKSTVTIVAPAVAVTRGTAAQMLGMSLTTFEEVVQPHIKVIRRGRLRLVPVRELERWVEQNARRTV
jgi:excisionase family DNA binding protein